MATQTGGTATIPNVLVTVPKVVLHWELMLHPSRKGHKSLLKTHRPKLISRIHPTIDPEGGKPDYLTNSHMTTTSQDPGMLSIKPFCVSLSSLLAWPPSCAGCIVGWLSLAVLSWPLVAHSPCPWTSCPVRGPRSPSSACRSLQFLSTKSCTHRRAGAGEGLDPEARPPQKGTVFPTA